MVPTPERCVKARTIRRQRLRERCRLLTAPCTKWNSVGSFRGASPFGAVRRLGPGGGRNLAGFAPINPNFRARCPNVGNGGRARFRAGSGSSSGIEGGMSSGTRFLPATQRR